MTDVQELLKRQAAWQKRRAKLSWEEKLRMAETMRETVIAFRKMREAARSDRKESPSE